MPPLTKSQPAAQVEDGVGGLPPALPSLGDIATQYGAQVLTQWPELVAVVGAGLALYRRHPGVRRWVDTNVLKGFKANGGR